MSVEAAVSAEALETDWERLWEKCPPFRTRVLKVIGKCLLFRAAARLDRSPCSLRWQRLERDRGLPQGSPISLLLANLYLDTFDEELIDQGCLLVRFADDFVVLTKDPEMARAAKTETEEALARLRLELNPDETAIRSIDDGFW